MAEESYTHHDRGVYRDCLEFQILRRDPYLPGDFDFARFDQVSIRLAINDQEVSQWRSAAEWVIHDFTDLSTGSTPEIVVRAARVCLTGMLDAQRRSNALIHQSLVRKDTVRRAKKYIRGLNCTENNSILRELEGIYNTSDLQEALSKISLIQDPVERKRLKKETITSLIDKQAKSRQLLQDELANFENGRLSIWFNEAAYMTELDRVYGRTSAKVMRIIKPRIENELIKRISLN